ncbi:GNAT family N-acetyltransferase [Streptomyces sp. NBC_01445]|uniref:GNAT family N-acetyltransferase n=1 Tax=Streptomyces sp. NBC_01445 TaxID=2903869 RepID=UPI003FA3B84A
MRATGAPASSTRRIWSEPCDQVRDSRPGFGLVAAGEHGTVTGIIDVTVEVELATIDTVAVHPDHQNQGLGRRFLPGHAPVSARWVCCGRLDQGRSGRIALLSGYGLHREPALHPLMPAPYPPGSPI